MTPRFSPELHAVSEVGSGLSKTPEVLDTDPPRPYTSQLPYSPSLPREVPSPALVLLLPPFLGCLAISLRTPDRGMHAECYPPCCPDGRSRWGSPRMGADRRCERGE